MTGYENYNKQQNMNFLRYVLGFILLSGTFIAGIKILIEIDYKCRADAQVRVVRECSDGLDRLADKILLKFD